MRMELPGEREEVRKMREEQQRSLGRKHSGFLE